MKSAERAIQFGNHHSADLNWLARAGPEEIIEPDRPIIDAHHHLWQINGKLNKSRRGESVRYLVDDFAEDIRTGHNIVATVFVECHMAWRSKGPEFARSLGEIEFARGQAAMAENGQFGPAQIAAGIVANINLLAGADLPGLIEEAKTIGGRRLCSVRHSAHWDPDPAVRNGKNVTGPALYLDSKFREGFTHFSKSGLAFDAWVFHPQLSDVTSLARAFPDTVIIMNHMGGPLGLGHYARDMDEVYRVWKRGISELARCQNVVVKLGGATNRVHNFMGRDRPPLSAELAAHWKPYIETCIDLFGARRCMFESSFPVDKIGAGYAAHWNAFKRLSADASPQEKHALFFATAQKAYKLDLSADSGASQKSSVSKFSEK